MNTSGARTTFSEAMPQSINYLKEGIATAKEHLPTLLKLLGPYIVAYVLCSLLFAAEIESLPPNLTETDLKNPEIARGVVQAVGIPLATLILVVLPLSVYCMFAVLRFASQDPLPQPSTQTIGSLWRFDTGLFTFLGMCLVQVLLGILFMIPGSIASLLLGLLLFPLPATAVAFLGGLPVAFTMALWTCFFALSGLSLLKSPQGGISAAIGHAKSVMTGNAPLWIMIALLAMVGQIAQQAPTWALSTPTSPAPAAAMLMTTLVGVVVSVLILLTCRAASKS